MTKTTNAGRMYGSPSQPRLKKRKKIPYWELLLIIHNFYIRCYILCVFVCLINMYFIFKFTYFLNAFCAGYVILYIYLNTLFS